MDQATDRANDLRLNWFVSPRLEFQRATATNRFGVGRFVQWETHNVPGQRRDQLLTALRRWVRHEAKHVLISDDPGQGKTVLSLRVEHLLCRKKTRERIFGDKLPRLVVHWMSRLPATKYSEPTLHDLLMVDPSLIQWLKKLKESKPEPVDPQKIIDYALENDRLIIILDAYDELPEAQKILFGKLFRKTCNQVRWIITGRDWAINREIADNIFHPNEFFRLRIKAFDSSLQDRYMEKALPGIDWRAALEGSKEEWDELLGLPATLRALVDALSMSGAEPQASLRFSSPSDLFCYCSSVMLLRELKKENNVQSLRALNQKPAKAVGFVQRALGAVALEMALRGHWREVIKETTRDLDNEIDEVWVAATTRFLRGAPPGQEAEYANIWPWVKKFLNEYQFHGGAPQADLNAQSMVFRNLRIHELCIARYLSDFATDEDLRGGPDSEKTGKVKQDNHGTNVLQYLGDEKWENTWLCAIRMPIRDEGKPHGVTAEQYKQSMLLLFERPANPKLRRPTELMFIADRWIRSTPTFADLCNDFRWQLGEQFKEKYKQVIQTGTNEQKQAIEELMSDENYVFLADPNNKVRIASDWGECIEDVLDTGVFWIDYPRESVLVRLTPFGIGKCAVSNIQYQFWDDNFASSRQMDIMLPEGVSQKDRLRDFQGIEQPAIFVSWYDSFWLSEFLRFGMQSIGRKFEKNGKRWEFKLPTEAQFEYALRAGGTGQFFRDEYGYEVTKKTLAKYAHFWQGLDRAATVSVKSTEIKPNAWGLRASGNVWKWVYDQYYEERKVGYDPLAADDDKIGSSRVIRGGGWFDDADDCSSEARLDKQPAGRSDDLGLMLALSPVAPPLGYRIKLSHRQWAHGEQSRNVSGTTVSNVQSCV